MLPSGGVQETRMLPALAAAVTPLGAAGTRSLVAWTGSDQGPLPAWLWALTRYWYAVPSALSVWMNAVSPALRLTVCLSSELAAP